LFSKGLPDLVELLLVSIIPEWLTIQTILRTERQGSTKGDEKSHIEVQGSVGLLLFDFVEAIHFPHEQHRANLGVALSVEIKEDIYSTAQIDQLVIQVESG
jgi:hypothetical protein